ncbi:MAG: MBOAT family protein [Lachnospiraceae bacterium]|nr:MBOAT family protein [Lachnospiraceae bacterium]
MLFNSAAFVLFFPVVFLGYLVLPKRLRPLFLLLASYFFYMSWQPKYALLIAGNTLVSYCGALLLERFAGEDRRQQNIRKRIVTGCTCLSFAALFCFKYFDFFLENVNAVLRAFGGGGMTNPLNLLLPVGISFYTFQSIGYLIDVSRRKIAAEHNLIDYALFVSFFPQLVAGPIERSSSLLKQLKSLKEKTPVTMEGLSSGFALMLWGYFQKMILADRLSILVDGIYDALPFAGTIETLAAMFGFSLQIYFDFAGYSAIAIGCARMMGIHLMQNFRTPYFATSISDFWHRWHISLSTWFRDYLYIPLGGNRKGRVRKYVNLMITFLLSGLWHGADWTFVFWGGLHGFFQIIGDLKKPAEERLMRSLGLKEDAGSFRFFRILGTFLLTSFAWIFFRAESMKQAFLLIRRMVSGFDPWNLMNGNLYTYGLDRLEMGVLLAGLLIVFAVSCLCKRREEDFGSLLYRQNLPARFVCMILLATLVLVFGKYGVHFDSQQFIYFAF